MFRLDKMMRSILPRATAVVSAAVIAEHYYSSDKHSGSIRATVTCEQEGRNSSRRSTGGLDSKIGNTPLILLPTLSAATGCSIYAKCEFMNPTGSVKDRAARGILEAAESSGVLLPGGTIVEGTGGNTGISLAQLGAARGYKVILCMPKNVSESKIAYMRVLGAEVHVQPLVPFGDKQHYFQLAENIAIERDGLFTNQFENKANYLAHFSGTGPEIYRQTDRGVDIFVSASGTGGTIAGVSAFLKSVKPTVQCVLADPAGSSLISYVNSKGTVLQPSEGSTVAEGIGSGRITANFGEAVVDYGVGITDEELVAMAYYLMKHEGVYVGPSAALNVVAAVKVALKKENKHSGKSIVTILCDSGERYSTKMYDTHWLEKNNLSDASKQGKDLSFLLPPIKADE